MRAARNLMPMTVALGVLMMLAGCYRHVVRAEGTAARQHDVYQPNMRDDRLPVVDDLEDAVFEPERDRKPRTGRRIPPEMLQQP